MAEDTVTLRIADQNAAIRYLGEMQSRAMDPIHEPIQNLLDEGARRIDVELDPQGRQIQILGDARPITSTGEARRILHSICESRKVGKLGEKGIGMLSFVTVARSMTTLSQKDGKIVWFTLETQNLTAGRVGSSRGNRLPYSGSGIILKGVSSKNLKFRFSEDRVVRDIKRRWGALLSSGLRIFVNKKDVAAFQPPPEGEPFTRTIPVPGVGKNATIDVSLMILKEPSEIASVSVTHKGQGNFLISEVPIFGGLNAFTQGMLHGTITGDIAPLNASRSGFQETKAFDIWVDRVLEIETELATLIEERIRTAAENKDAAMLQDWMKHLKKVFHGTELETTVTSTGEGDELGWHEEPRPAADRGGGGGGRNGAATDREPRDRAGDDSQRGGMGRLPTVPYAGFTKAPPSVRIVRERKAFRINVNHADYIKAAKDPNGRRKYLRELCMHEAYIFSLEGKARDWYIERADEFLGYWTRAFIGK